MARRDPRAAVAVWTIAPIRDYTEAELLFAVQVHAQLGRGTLYLALPGGHSSGPR